MTHIRGAKNPARLDCNFGRRIDLGIWHEENFLKKASSRQDSLSLLPSLFSSPSTSSSLPILLPLSFIFNSTLVSRLISWSIYNQSHPHSQQPHSDYPNISTMFISRTLISFLAIGTSTLLFSNQVQASPVLKLSGSPADQIAAREINVASGSSGLLGVFERSGSLEMEKR